MRPRPFPLTASCIPARSKPPDWFIPCAAWTIWKGLACSTSYCGHRNSPPKETGYALQKVQRNSAVLSTPGCPPRALSNAGLRILLCRYIFALNDVKSASPEKLVAHGPRGREQG